MTNLINIDTTSATRPAIVGALKDADAYRQVARFSADELREYARKVQVIRMDGENAPLSASNVDAMMTPGAQVPAEPEQVVEPAAEPTSTEPTSTEPTSTEPTSTEPTAEELLAALDATVAKKTKARKTRAPGTVSQKFIDLFAATVKGANADENGVITITAEMIEAAGWSPAYRNLRNGWGSNKTAGLAAKANGFTTRTRKADVPTGFVVEATPVAPAAE